MLAMLPYIPSLALHQGSANYLFWTIKFHENTATPVCLNLFYGLFHATELSSCVRDHVAGKARNITVWPLTENACNFRFKLIDFPPNPCRDFSEIQSANSPEYQQYFLSFLGVSCYRQQVEGCMFFINKAYFRAFSGSQWSWVESTESSYIAPVPTHAKPPPLSTQEHYICYNGTSIDTSS